jgi:nucleoside-triphosphatase THEP1
MNEQVIILTGEKQTGKTTFLQEWSEGRNDVAGLLTPVMDGKRCFYDIVKKEYFEMESVSESDRRLSVGKYFFLEEAFNNAADRLLAMSTVENINYLIIDEIGPLEIEKKQGLYDCFIEILDKPFQYVLIVIVRPTLIETISTIVDQHHKTSVVMTINELTEYLKTGVSKPAI